MQWLNYHHLLYFYVTAREGSVTAAARELHLTQPTLSAQIRQLEDQFGEKLFEKRGRRLVLTDVGQTVYRYADEIFAIGRELTETVRGRPSGRTPVLRVGVANVLPKLVVVRLLEPALRIAGGVRLKCHEEAVERLLAQLAAHELDVVLSDAPLEPDAPVKAHAHLLGESAVAVYAAPELAERLQPGFPRSLDGAPFLLPVLRTEARRSLDDWFEQLGVIPRIVGEFEDSALIRAFAELGAGACALSAAVGDRVVSPALVPLGLVDGMRERYYAITVERRLEHPAVVAVAEAAKSILGGEP